MDSQQAFVTSFLPITKFNSSSSLSTRTSLQQQVKRRKFTTTTSSRTIRATIAVPSSSPKTSSKEAEEEIENLISIKSPEQFDSICEKALATNSLICIDFMASWCRKCKYLLPRFKKMALKYPNVYFCTVDVNKVNRLPKQFSILKMPTFIFMQSNQILHTLIGGAAPPQVANQLESNVQKYATSPTTTSTTTTTTTSTSTSTSTST